MLLAWLALLAPAVLGATVSGTVTDSVSGFGVPYVQVSVSPPGGETRIAVTDVFGNYSVTVSSSGDGAIFASNHAGYFGASALSPSFAVQPLASLPSGLRVSLTWGADPDDLDLRGISQCGTVSFATRLRINGGTPWRLDRDATSGFGPETIRALDHLPCGNYEFYARVLGDDGGFRAGMATVSVFNDQLSEPLFTFQSGTPPTGNSRGWWIFTYRVRLLNSITRERSYVIIPRNIYQNDPPPSTFDPQCTGDSQWCAVSAAVRISAPLLWVASTVALVAATLTL